MKKAILSLVALLASAALMAQNEVIRIWENGAPGAKASETYTEEIKYLGENETNPRIYKVTDPTLTAFIPKEKSAEPYKAIIICPGGGYVRQDCNNEGAYVAEALNENGIAAFVLKYRLPSDEIMENRALGPLQDIQRAVRLVRENAAKWNIDPNCIGVMGFSAGGHLASTGATLFGFPAYDAGADAVSARPDFAALIYPVISMEPGITHGGSRKALIGGLKNDRYYENLLSTEKQVRFDTPPCFLVHAANDNGVPYKNSAQFVDAMAKNNRSVEYHILPSGGHGFGLAKGTHNSLWLTWLVDWLKTIKK